MAFSFSAATAVAINYTWNLKNIPSVGEALPIEVVAALLGIAIFLLCIFLMHRRSAAQQDTFNGEPYQVVGLGGYNCVQAAQIIINKLLDGSSVPVVTTNTIVPAILAKEMARRAYDALSKKLREYKTETAHELQEQVASQQSLPDALATLRDMLQTINIIELSGRGTAEDRQIIEEIKRTLPILALIQALDKLGKQLRKYQGEPWSDLKEAGGYHFDLNSAVEYLLKFSLNRAEQAQRLLRRYKFCFDDLGVDFQRRVANLPPLLFCATAAAIPGILFATGNLDALNLEPGVTAIVLCSAIFLITALLMSAAITRNSLFSVNLGNSMNEICDDIIQALEAMSNLSKEEIANLQYERPKTSDQHSKQPIIHSFE